MAQSAAVCEGCREAFLEYANEEMGFDFEWDATTEMCREWGSEIADHTCPNRDEGLPCGCGCRVHDRA